MTTQSSLDVAAHVVQLALTPVFLLSGLAALLNAFSSRFGRVADRVGKLAENPGDHARQLAALRRRTHVLDVAVLAASVAGALTCRGPQPLRRSARHGDHRTPPLRAFGAAVVFTAVALAAFATETILSSAAVREQVDDAS